MASTAHFPDHVSFQQQANEFISWLSSKPLVSINPKICMVDLGSSNVEQGVDRLPSIPLVAQAEIPENEELFVIHGSLVLSVHNSKLSEVLGQDLNELGPWMSLILVMIYEYLAGEQSAWAPYFKILPKKFDTLMFWSPSELQELQGSAVVDKIGKEEADQAILEIIAPIVRKNPSLFPPPDGLTSYDSDAGAQALLHLGQVMGSLILAFAFDLEKADDNDDEAGEGEDGYMTDEDDEQAAKGMVPLADLLKASTNGHNAHLSQEEDGFIMKATRTISVGEEILIDYGEIPRADLLRRYGFVSDDYAQYDVVELPLSDICHAAGLSNDDVDSQPPLQFLAELDILDDGYDIPRFSNEDALSDILPEELQYLLKTLALSPDQLQQQQSKNKPPKASIGPQELTILQKALELRRAQYGTDIQQDKEILSRLNESSGSSRRQQMAIMVRIGEKTILQDMSAILADPARNGEAGSTLKRNANGDQDDDLRKAKAQRT